MTIILEMKSKVEYSQKLVVLLDLKLIEKQTSKLKLTALYDIVSLPSV